MNTKFKKHFMPIVALLLGVAFIGFCVYATILGFMQHEVGIALVLMIGAMCTTWFTAWLVVCMVKEAFWVRRERKEQE